MKITEKGQVTIPKNIRERFGLTPGSEVRFVEKDRKIFLEKEAQPDAWGRWYGYLKLKNVRTDELIRQMRGPRP